MAHYSKPVLIKQINNYYFLEIRILIALLSNMLSVMLNICLPSKIKFYMLQFFFYLYTNYSNTKVSYLI